MVVETTIRKVTHSDLPAIAELFAEMMDYHAERDPIFATTEQASHIFARWFVGQADIDETIPLVAVVDNQVVGYALGITRQRGPVYADRSYGEVNDLAVTAECRRQGIGERLCRAVFGWFVARGISRVEARVASTNEAAVAFWRKLGFSPYTEIVAGSVPDMENPEDLRRAGRQSSAPKGEANR